MTGVIVVKPRRPRAVVVNTGKRGAVQMNRSGDGAAAYDARHTALSTLYKLSKADREAALQAGRDWAARQAERLSGHNRGVK